MGLYRYGLDVTIRGEAYLPVSENFIVVANHSSHLDGGLVKYALGPWGDRVYTLAAKDYFFGTPARRFFAHHFTRLIPTDRQKVTSDWLRRSRDVLANGECVLIFPEGTRTATPELQPFKASLGTLVRTSQAPVLPIFIEGTWDILPKGSAIPKGRKVTVHLGPLMSWEYLSEKTKELGTLQQDRAIAQLVQDAVDGLKDGQIGWLEAPKKSEPVEPAHHEHPHP